MHKNGNEILDNDSAKFPNGWEIGDICVMSTNKKKSGTQEYIIKGYNGTYFELRDKYGRLHRASVARMFRNRKDALLSLKNNVQKRSEK